MKNIEHDGQVHYPLGGASYIFEQDILDWILKRTRKNKIRISIGAQPNSSPHLGTLTVFSLAFALGAMLKEKTSKQAEVLYEHFKDKFGEKGMETLFYEVKSWIEKPYKLFRNYSVYYFMNLFEHEQRSNF